MKDYLLHTLSPSAFEDLIVKICHEILGFGTISFSSGKDGGRDAFFGGTAQRFPSEAEPWSGSFVIQAKHTEKTDASCSDSDFERLLFFQSSRAGAPKPEASKVSAHRCKGRCDCYLLFTNRKLGALTEEKLVEKLRQKTSVPNVAILGKETITSYLDGAPQIAEAMGLQVSPFVAGLPTIPPPIRDFAGRTDELEELRRMVAEHGGALIYGVRGLGGIGKTELGLKLVELVGDDYPDGHILVELGGASDHPLSTADAMASVIRAYEPQLRLPEAEADLRRMYHQMLKDRRAIVLLDDAAGAEQAEPLLPHTGCLTLVTSRQRFALPKLHRLDLDALAPEAARGLLLSLAPRLGTEAERLAELLGRLPLALRLAGSAFAERPDLEPDEYFHQLESRDERLGLVEAAIGFNYEALVPELQRQWRALAVFPGDFDVSGAAAVWAVEADDAKEVLGGALYPVSLVEWQGGRYRLHDLARDFAGSQLDDEERQTAARRHAGHYVGALFKAEQLYSKGGDGILQGVALFESEWSNVRAGQAWASANANADQQAMAYCSRYPFAGINCLSLRLHRRELIRWLERGRSTSATLGERRREAYAVCGLCAAYQESGKVEKAIEYCEEALCISQEIGDLVGEGTSLGNLSNAYYRLGEVEKAIGYHEQALAIFRQIGDRRREGAALGGLGAAYRRLGRNQKAIGYYKQALEIARQSGDLRGEATWLGNLGQAYWGQSEKSIDYTNRALAITREIGDRLGEGNHLGRLCATYEKLGQVEKAIEFCGQALAIAREISDRPGEGNRLGNLGSAYYRGGKTDTAVGYYEQALVIAREIADPRSEGTWAANLGLAYARLGEVEKAVGYYEQALAIGRAIKDPLIVSVCSEQLERLRES